MADDNEMLKEVWEGRVPVAFRLSTNEVFMEEPEQLYYVLPRQTYFPLANAIEKVQKHFSKFINPDQEGEMWFEEDGNPIRWHYPIGVLFDLMASPSRLPWTLTVHFRDFPETDILRCPGKDAVESLFMSSVKEADFLKHRGQTINTMTETEHKKLFLGLSSERYDQFWSINRKLMEHAGGELFRYIPFKIHQVDKPYIQFLFRPISDDGRQNTLEDLLKQALPDTSFNPEETKYRILIQGIEPALSTSIQWLSEHLSYPDNFLHICLSPK